MKKYRLSSIQEALNYYTLNENGCFIFDGSKQNGYGIFSVNGKSYRAHRASFENSFGSIPEDKMICHKCNEQSCINPAHLYAGTHKDNNRDRFIKNLKGYFNAENLKYPTHKELFINENKNNEECFMHSEIMDSALQELVDDEIYEYIKNYKKHQKNKNTKLMSIYLTKNLYTKLKQFSLLTNTSMSQFIRTAIMKEIKSLSNQIRSEDDR